jgi:putative sigma-54 modulation protein
MADKVDILGRNMEITDRIQEYVEKKAGKLDHYLREIEEIRVDLANLKSARSAADRNVAQITVRGKNLLLRVEERADDIFAAFDTAIDKMQRQIDRYKGKRHHGRPEPRAEMMEVEPVVDDDEELPVVVRRKKFALVPMNEAEALEQMSLLGHDNFFIFYNADASSIQVIYRRRDGTYGLIEPHLA